MLVEGWGRRAGKHVDILNTDLGGLSQIRGSMGIERKAGDEKTPPREEGERAYYDTAPFLYVEVRESRSDVSSKRSVGS